MKKAGENHDRLFDNTMGCNGHSRSFRNNRCICNGFDITMNENYFWESNPILIFDDISFMFTNMYKKSFWQKVKWYLKEIFYINYFIKRRSKKSRITIINYGRNYR